MENTVFMDSTVCCICFEIQNEAIPLHTQEHGIPLYEKLLNYTNINLNIEDSRKAFICRQCMNELKVCVQFLTKCLKASECLKRAKSTVNDMQLNGEASENCGTECNNDIRQASYVEVKQIIHTSNGDVNKDSDFSCQFCSKVFTRKFNLKLHELRHISCSYPVKTPSKPARSCPLCSKSYTSYSNLKDHMRTHTGERPFVCSDCGKAFGSKKILTDHIRIHTGVKPYMCPVCGKQFTTNKLSAHMKTHEGRAPTTTTTTTTTTTERGRHACTMCVARYNHKQSLNKHIRNTHGLNPSEACKRNDAVGFT